MNNNEIKSFINCMKEAGDTWEREDVKRVYGNMSLEEALQDRINDLHWFAGIVAKVTNSLS